MREGGKGGGREERRGEIVKKNSSRKAKVKSR